MHTTEVAAVTGSEVRLFLVGKTGVGTSSTANTILGRSVFPSAYSFSSLTNRCQTQSSTVTNRTVTVVDSPNFFNSALSRKDFCKEIERGVKLCSPGVHALLFTVTLDTFTEQEVDVVSLFKKLFGEDAMRYTVIVFTHGDKIQNYSIEEMIRKNERLSALVDACGRRYHVLNNKDLSNRTQVTELLEKIDIMAAANGNSCYTLEMFHNAQSLRAYYKRAVLAALQVNPHYLYLICVIVMIMGGTGVHNRSSAGVLPFTLRCLSGVSSAVVGAVSGKVWVHMLWKYASQQQNQLKFLGIPCGFITGAITGYSLSPAGVIFAGLAGLAGAVGAAAVTKGIR